MTEPARTPLYYLLWLCVASLAIVISTKLLQVDSLWLDETVTFWIVKDGFSEVVERSLAFQGQSPLYYLLVWGFCELFGQSVFMLRFMSLCFSFATLVLLAAMASRIFSKSTVFFSALVLISLDSFQVSMISARPYALALFFSLASSYCLLRWFKQQNFFWGLFYVVSGSFTFYAHYLFSAVFLVHFIHACLEARREKSFRDLARLLFAFTLIFALCLPALNHLLSLYWSAESLQFAAIPGPLEFIKQWFPFDLFVYLFAASVCVWVVLGNEFNRPHLSGPSGFIFLGLFAPLVFIPALYFSLHISLFMERYFLWYLPFLALCGGVLFSCLKTERARAVFIVVFTILSLARSIDKKWQVENWRAASQAVAQLEQVEDKLLLVNSGLIEHREVNNYDYPQHLEYLLAPFAAYPNKAQKLPIPFSFEDEEAKAYFEEKLKPRLLLQQEFWLVCLGQQKLISSKAASQTLLQDYYQTTFSALGFNLQGLQSFGQVSLLEFHR